MRIAKLFTACVVTGCLAACAALTAYGQDEAGEQEQTQQVEMPSEYQWIFGTTSLPAVGEDGQLVQEEESPPQPQSALPRMQGVGVGVGAGVQKETVEPLQEEPLSRGASIDPFTWDFGEVETGRVLEHEFMVENKSQRTMQIKSVNTSCGCTVSQVDKRTLAPGESTPVAVRFKTKGYHGDIKQSVFVHTDDPRQPVIRYIVKAKIIRAEVSR